MAMKTLCAGRSNSRQRRRGGSLHPEPGASSGGGPISGRADAVRRSQQKVQPASRMKISRYSECDEPQVVRGFPEDQQGHSRNHVEEAYERKPNKRKDATFYDDKKDAPRQTNKHSTGWRSDVPPPCLCGASHGWVPVNTHGTPVLTSVRRLWVGSTTTTRTRR